MRLTSLRLLPVAVVLAVALTHAQAPTPQAAPTGAFPAPGAPPTVTVLSTGADPKVEIRFRPKPGQRETMEMRTSMRMTMGMADMAMPEMAMPPMRLVADVIVSSVAPNGDITFETVFTDATAEAAAGADPTLVAALGPALASVKALKGVTVMNNRGVVLSNKLSLDSVADPIAKQTLQQSMSSFSSFSLQMPTEAVGVGARWEVRSTQDAGGMAVQQKTTAEVVSVDATQFTIRTTAEQGASPQKVANPALPPGASMQLDSLAGTTRGRVSGRFDSMVPAGDMTGRTETKMTMEMGGEKQAISTTMTMGMAVAIKK